jgi:purine-binding chemotaxis protein CheW
MEKSLTSYLTFKLGEETFAASVSKVIEILEIPKITKVPRSPAFMRGVVNLRGNVLSVIDSRI